MIKKRNLFTILLFLLGLTILFLLIYSIGFKVIIDTLKKTNHYFLILGVGTYFLSILNRALKWYLILNDDKNKIPFKDFFPLYNINALITSITPAKSGDLVVAPIIFKKYLKISINRIGSVIILDRFYEVLFLVIFMVLGMFHLILLKQISSLLVNSFIIAITLLLILLAFLLLMLNYTTIFMKVLIRLKNYLKNPIFVSLIEFINRELNIFCRNTKQYKKRKIFKFLVPLTISAWFLQIMAFYFIMKSIFSIPFFLFASSLFISIGVGIVSFIPLGIGSVTITWAYILSLFEYPMAQTTSGWILIITLSITSMFLYAMISLFYLRKYSSYALSRKK